MDADLISSGTSEKDKNGRFGFLNLAEVESSIIVDRIKKIFSVEIKYSFH